MTKGLRNYKEGNYNLYRVSLLRGDGYRESNLFNPAGATSVYE